MANIMQKARTPKIKILGYYVSGATLDIEYQIGDEDYREKKLDEGDINEIVPVVNRMVDIPSSFNPFSGAMQWSSTLISIADYLELHADEVVQSWKEREEINLLTQ